ncbi:MAG TPA: multiheme c-type cytochrome [Tepidisphaeraceae bacterium]|jgi:hypothetical protein
MARPRSTSTLLAVALATAGLFLIAAPLLPVARAADEIKQQPNAHLIALGHKFEGAAGCNNANCHGAATPKQAPKPAGNEYLTWSDKDKHAEAFKTLTKDASNEIIKKLGRPEKPDASPLCTNCHALAAPANLQMGKFNLKEGVTCGACHGPYEKWAEPHNKEGGANDLRKKCGYATLDAENLPYSTQSPEHQKLLKDFGLYDTRPILARAEKCTSCHLAIDPKLVDAGHPQPIFELAYYTAIENPHWREPAGYWGTKVWAAGQVVCLRDAMLQLAERATSGASDKLVKDALDQALGHLEVFRHLTGGGAATALETAAKDLKSAGADKGKLATAAKSAADAASRMMTAVATLKPADANTAALLGKIAKDAEPAKDAGLRGAQQQALALSSLCASYRTGKGNVPGGEDVQKIIDEKLLAAVGDEASFKPDDYAKTLQEAATKLSLMLPGGGGNVPDPIDLK